MRSGEKGGVCQGAAQSACGDVWWRFAQEAPRAEVSGAQWSRDDGGDTLHTLKELEHKQPQFVN